MARGQGDGLEQAARKVRRRVLAALALTGLLPLLVMLHVLHTYALPGLPAEDHLRWWSLQLLGLFTALAISVGAWLIWDLGTQVARLVGLVGGGATEEVSAVVASVGRLLGTIEQQSHDIASFTGKLDTAYRQLEASNSQLKDLSFRDELTGLHNRRYLTIRLEDEMSRFRRFEHPVAVVLLDLDGFKTINDTCGHAVGDETLKVVARVLVEQSRATHVAARQGGDEFVLLLPETTGEGAGAYAERIRATIAATPFAHGLPVSASLGVAALPETGAATADELLAAADRALYAAKAAGRNRVVALGAKEVAA